METISTFINGMHDDTFIILWFVLFGSLVLMSCVSVQWVYCKVTGKEFL